ncbi:MULTISPECIES: GNAT family N-acetyltransferase [unclassified Streptomyces]|uniref:GNAT family N-acetyltransferase n=1 Tax=unclassified Streptomyces TaxID=2593676 RepID=UPI0006FB39D2|nr:MULTISPECIES: GNAT family N-acetyltransferase [unclassified Streptomyces]KQX49959.1 GCN5 family acetyltransferase [Streptomyces sp. Root1304]KRA79998.1 GCN5 family acetyltransferase [Streptomyces sp. Root66D1]
METQHLRDLFDRQLRREARPDGPGCRIERVGDVVRQTGPAHAWNGVLWSGLGDGDADRTVADQIDHYRAAGLSFEWKLYAHDTPADLGDRLLAAGFTAEDPETVMVAEAAALPGDVPLPEDVELRAVTDESGVRQVVEVHERAFGTDSAHIGRQLLDRLAADPDTVTAVVALAAGEPVSAARLELCPGTDFAGLWGGGTVEGWRGRGLYRALVSHRARIAAERGHRYVQVDAADTSRPILHRLGFLTLTTTTPHTYGG